MPDDRLQRTREAYRESCRHPSPIYVIAGLGLKDYMRCDCGIVMSYEFWRKHVDEQRTGDETA